VKAEIDQKRQKILLFTLICIFFMQFACNFPLSDHSDDTFLVTSMAMTAESLETPREKDESLKPTPTNVSTPIAIINYIDEETNYQFVIQKVKSGDSLNQYAELYNTSVGAIIRVNYAMNLPLWDNALVIIPVGFTDVEQLPYFQPYRVTAEVITLKDLAIELAVNLEDLIYYNSLNGKNEVYSGDWLIIPRMSPGY
jgi:hypothetical protein